MARGLNINRRAFTHFIDRCKPDDPTQDIILAALSRLAQDPSLGYRVYFVYPPLFRIDIPPYVANYEFDAELVTVLYLGIIGKCP